MAKKRTRRGSNSSTAEGNGDSRNSNDSGRDFDDRSSNQSNDNSSSVSYTHLTLPTIYSV